MRHIVTQHFATAALWMAMAAGCPSLIRAEGLAPGKPASVSVQDAGREYLAVVGRLVVDLPQDSENLLHQAKSLAESYRAEFQRVGELVQRCGEPDARHVRVGGRIIPKDKLLSSLFELGEASRQVQAVGQWLEFSIKFERLQLTAAKAEANRRNADEIAKAYAEFQSQLMARHMAASKLGLLMSGRGRVQVTESIRTTSGGGAFTNKRSASAGEAQAFAASLAAFANSAIRVAPPLRHDAVEIHTVERLAALKAQQPQLKHLRRVIDDELRALADAHLAAVQEVLTANGDDLIAFALASLGWWNGPVGLSLIDQNLDHARDVRRHAALAALGRMRLSPAQIKSYVRRGSPEVRMNVARLAGEQVQDVRDALEPIRELLKDGNADVRSTAYRVFEQLAAMCQASIPEQCTQVAAAVRSADPEATNAAIDWITNSGGVESLKYADVKKSLLTPFLRRRDDAVSAHAQAALWLIKSQLEQQHKKRD
jgi:hypothetical protein